MSFLRHVVMCLATGCYLGRIPFAPGTWGSLLGIPLAYGLSLLPWSLSIPVFVLFVVAAVGIAHLAERQLGQKDPGSIVIDEVAGQCLALMFIPLTAFTCIAAFLLFRLFDIAKPPPARYLEKRFSGGLGIVLDDLAAGIMAHIVLRVGLFVIGPG